MEKGKSLWIAVASVAVGMILGLIWLLSRTPGQEGGTVTEPEEQIPGNAYSAQAFQVVDGFLTYQEGHSAIGVDVSSYQGEIDWQQVADAGVEFAIVRVGLRGYTQGGLMEDNNYVKNLEGALAAGLDVGVYIFSQAVTTQEAVEEAEFLLERIAGYSITYPVVYDWEEQQAEGSRTAGLPGSVQTDCAAAFCERIAQAGYQPMVYFSPTKAYEELELERLTDWPFWLAHYTQDWQATTFRYHFAMWQYTDQGQVSGIPGAVDLNLCLKDFSAGEEG
ncbi:MAG TPA: hypothetical protein DIT49_05130 [Clostridiales bacterium]|nr:hypothetical protein [Clostridiales bacterium]